MEAGPGVGVSKAGLGLSGGILSAEICGANPSSLSLLGYGRENQFTYYLPCCCGYSSYLSCMDCH